MVFHLRVPFITLRFAFLRAIILVLLIDKVFERKIRIVKGKRLELDSSLFLCGKQPIRLKERGKDESSI